MKLTEEDRIELRAVLKPGGYDRSVAARAQMVLWYDQGYRKVQIVAMSGASQPTVNKWLKRYALFGLAGLESGCSPGAPRQIPNRIRARVLALTRTSPPAELGISHWSSREMARYIRKTEGIYVSQPWVAQLWREHGLAPWRQRTFKISKDPCFEDKVHDVVDLYRTPPKGEAVVSVDAKSAIQALAPTQTPLPVDADKTPTRTHDYTRRGTTDLYAALDVRTGHVISSLSPTHTSADFLRLMDKVLQAYPSQKVHVVLDNASPHQSAETKKWLARHGDTVVFHFTPTGASWMNLVEIWNGILTRKLIRCGMFDSVMILNQEIEAFIERWNRDDQPIIWTATAEEILDKVRAITARMEALLRATEINDVTRQAA